MSLLASLPLPCLPSEPLPLQYKKLNLHFFMKTVPPQPSVTPNLEQPRYGFNRYAERLNGRAAMIGFVIALLVEYFTGQGVLTWLGLR